MAKLIVLLILFAASWTARAQYTTYTNQAMWEAAVAAFPDPGQVTFQGALDGTVLTTEYVIDGILFEGDDRAETSATLFLDAKGVEGLGDIEITFTQPVVAIGVVHPQQLVIFDDAGSSSTCGAAGGPAGAFCGIVLPAGQSTIGLTFRDPWDNGAHIDDLLIVFEPENLPLRVCGSGATLIKLYERIGADWVFVAQKPSPPSGCVSFQELAPGALYRAQVIGSKP